MNPNEMNLKLMLLMFGATTLVSDECSVEQALDETARLMVDVTDEDKQEILVILDAIKTFPRERVEQAIHDGSLESQDIFRKLCGVSEIPEPPLKIN